MTQPLDGGADAGGFAEAVDPRSATITASGHLTDLAVDLLRGTIDTLRRLGHHRITVDLHDVRATDATALTTLRSVATRLRAHRDELVVLPNEGKDG
jgi:anti-anti-sigma regulatory factor